MTKMSGRGLGLFVGALIYIGLPAYVLSGELPLALEGLSAAGGHPEGLSSFWIVATPLPGLDHRTILAAWLRAGSMDDRQVETVEVDGRIAFVYDNQAVHAVDGVVYWMTYLDLGDFPPASPAPRPAFRDVVVDALRALP